MIEIRGFDGIAYIELLLCAFMIEPLVVLDIFEVALLQPSNLLSDPPHLWRKQRASFVSRFFSRPKPFQPFL